MSAQSGPARTAMSTDRSIDDLDTEIFRLARQLNAETYRMLLLVRDFDDRFGFAKWGFAGCAEWLAWRCGLCLSAAREKVRTAQALRSVPVISAAFADGRLSYSKVRALARVAAHGDEDLLLAYALDASASEVEERCRPMRNVEPGSVHSARRAWERRSLTLFRDRARGVGADHRRAAGGGRRAHRASDRERGRGGRRGARRRVRLEHGAHRGRLASATGRCAGRDREVVSRRQRQSGIDHRPLPSRRARRRGSPPRRGGTLGLADRDGPSTNL